jgi:capsular polysaccharide biosynthesis protein
MNCVCGAEITPNVNYTRHSGLCETCFRELKGEFYMDETVHTRKFNPKKHVKVSRRKTSLKLKSMKHLVEEEELIEELLEHDE